MKLKIIALVLVSLLIGCQSTAPKLPPMVTINNGVYSIPENGVFINGTDGMELKPGVYKFLVKKHWHRDKVQEITVEAGQQQFIQIKAGQEYAIGSIGVLPNITRFTLNDKEYQHNFSGELDVGTYTIKASAQGYFSQSFDFEVTTGNAFDLTFELETIPTSGVFSVTSMPQGAELTVNEVNKGIAPFIAKNLDFGTYRVSGIKQTSNNERLVGSNKYIFEREGSTIFNLVLDKKEKLFEGKWYSKAKAIKLQNQKIAHLKAEEEKRYQHVRTASPVEIQFNITSLNDKQAMSQADFSTALFTLIKVGDRLSVKMDDKTYIIWKRTAELSSSFNVQVAALWQSKPKKLAYKADPVKPLTFTQGSSLITTLAYQLYRSKNENPVVDLDENMHQFNSYKIPTINEKITVITIGGDNVSINGSSINVTALIGFKTFSATNQPLNLSWKTKPIKLLVVTDNDTILPIVIKQKELQVNEKQLVKLLQQGEVKQIQRFTKNPNNIWRYDLLVKSGPLADTLDLNVNEIGPHKLGGQYQRIWIIDYTDVKGINSKRQLTLDYAVGESVKHIESDNFFRRSDNK